jgi:hypothetical protein
MADEELQRIAERARDIDRETRDRVRSGGLDANVRRLLNAPFTATSWADQAEALAYIPSARPIASRGPLGLVSRTMKRAVRRVVAWYVHPITADQSRFNEAVVNRLHRLEQRVRLLQVPWADAESLLGAGTDGLVSARQAVLQRQAAPSTGVVLVCNAGASLSSSLTARMPQLVFWNDDPFDALQGFAEASLDGVYLAGVLQLLTAAQLIEILRLAKLTLHGDGWLICDAPESVDESDGTGESIRVAPPQRLRPSTVEALYRQCGFATAETFELVPAGNARGWFATMGTVER